MSSELPYRQDLEPLCPVDFRKMQSSNEEPPTFECPEPGCHIHWNRPNGYFYTDPADVSGKHAMLVGFLKMGFVVEHGYFYLASVDAVRKFWRCSVKECPNETIDNY